MRKRYFSELNQWLMAAPRYLRPYCTFQTNEWFQIAFHLATLSLYRPSRAIPMPSSEDLRICMESANWSYKLIQFSLCSEPDQIYFCGHTFPVHGGCRDALRSSGVSAIAAGINTPSCTNQHRHLPHAFPRNSNGRTVGEKCSRIIERLGNSILSLFDDATVPNAEVDTEFQSWFGLQTHTFSAVTES